MPNFKPKATKQIKMDKLSIITLDNKHNEMLKNFNDIDNIKIPDIEKNIQNLKNQLKRDLNLEKMLETADELKVLKKERRRLKKERKEYFLNNSKYIFDYFEKKREISEGHSKKKILHSFFNTQKQFSNEKINSTQTQKYLINVDEKFLDVNNYVQKNDYCVHCNGEMVQNLYLIWLNMKSHHIKNRLKKCVFMLINELIISERFWLNFKQKKRPRFHRKF